MIISSHHVPPVNIIIFASISSRGIFYLSLHNTNSIADNILLNSYHRTVLIV